MSATHAGSAQSNAITVVELGSDGRLLILQLDELMAGVEGERELVVRDYLVTGSGSQTGRFPVFSAVLASKSTATRHRLDGNTVSGTA